MTTVGLTALTARARGLSTHLLSRSTLELALAAPDLEGLARLLRDAGLPLAGGHALSSEALELGARRWAADELARLARWLPDGSGIAELLFADEDRRSVRAMVRGAAAGAAAELRLAGLIPTPRLPERLLKELARQSSVKSVAALLVTWQHPLGPGLLAAATADEPDLFAAERALTTAHLAALGTAAKRVGSGLRAWTAETIDLENVRTALQLATRVPEDELTAALHPGGLIPRAWIGKAAGLEALDARVEALAGLMPAGPVADALRRYGIDAVQLDDALLAARLTVLHRRARLDPLEAVSVLQFALRLRAQVTVLRLAIWRLALGGVPIVPGPLLEVV
jgi:vacuolar-type H+-ATPase subunit C/Vma6